MLQPTKLSTRLIYRESSQAQVIYPSISLGTLWKYDGSTSPASSHPASSISPMSAGFFSNGNPSLFLMFKQSNTPIHHIACSRLSTRVWCPVLFFSFIMGSAIHFDQIPSSYSNVRVAAFSQKVHKSGTLLAWRCSFIGHCTQQKSSSSKSA